MMNNKNKIKIRKNLNGKNEYFFLFNFNKKITLIK